MSSSYRLILSETAQDNFVEKVDMYVRGGYQPVGPPQVVFNPNIGKVTLVQALYRNEENENSSTI